MKLKEVKEVLDAEVVVGQDQLDMEVKKGACADLMSDLLVYCQAGSLLLTGLANHQVIRTAESSMRPPSSWSASVPCQRPSTGEELHTPPDNAIHPLR